MDSGAITMAILLGSFTFVSVFIIMALPDNTDLDD